MIHGLTITCANRGSYRNLLGTAETIVDMDEQMRTVEAHVTDIGMNCNLRTLEGKVSDSKKKIAAEKEKRKLELLMSLRAVL